MEKEATRTRQSSVIYRQLVAALLRRARDMGLPQWEVDDLAGAQDRYLAKIASPDTPAGRIAGWRVLDEYMAALWPDGFMVAVQPLGPALPRGARPDAPPRLPGTGGVHWRRLRNPRPLAYLTHPNLDLAMDQFVVRHEALRIAATAGGSPADVVKRARTYEAFLRGDGAAGSRPAPANDQETRHAGQR